MKILTLSNPNMDHITPSWCHVVATNTPSAIDPPGGEPLTCQHPHTFKIRITISDLQLRKRK